MNLEDLEDEPEDFEEVSFQDLFGAALADGSTTVIIESYLVDRVKQGVINAKQSARKRASRKGIPWDRVTLVFEEEKIESDAVQLTIKAVRKAVVRIRKFPKLELIDE